jgi:hypothetical protein
MTIGYTLQKIKMDENGAIDINYYEEIIINKDQLPPSSVSKYAYMIHSHDNKKCWYVDYLGDQLHPVPILFFMKYRLQT